MSWSHHHGSHHGGPKLSIPWKYVKFRSKMVQQHIWVVNILKHAMARWFGRVVYVCNWWLLLHAAACSVCLSLSLWMALFHARSCWTCCHAWRALDCSGRWLHWLTLTGTCCRSAPSSEWLVKRCRVINVCAVCCYDKLLCQLDSAVRDCLPFCQLCAVGPVERSLTHEYDDH